MPSIVDLAELANASYSDTASVVKVRSNIEAPAGASGKDLSFSPGNPLFQNALSQGLAACSAPTNFDEVWQRTNSKRDSFGFFAALYESGQERVIAFRGTDDLYDGLIDDAAILAGQAPRQVQAAISAANAFGISGQTWFTGHSLGGALAVIAACRLGLPAVTFNAPGVQSECVQSALTTTNGLQALLEMAGRCISNSRVRNIRIHGDPVSSMFTTGWQAGGNTQSYAAPTCGFDALCRHGMATCLAAVKADAANFTELQF